MLAWTGKGVVILLLIGVLLPDESRVEGLRCYKCGEFGIEPCTSDELKGKDVECQTGKDISSGYNCVKTTLDGNPKAIRGCQQISSSLDETIEAEKGGHYKRNGCVENKSNDGTIKFKHCFCDTDLCNGAMSTGTPSLLLITTMALIFSLPP